MARGFALEGGFGRGPGSFGFGFGGRESGTSFCGEPGADEVVGGAEERGEFSGGDGVGAFESNPLGAGEVGGGDDARTLCELGEGFIAGFDGEENGSGFEWRDGEHLACNFEDEVVAPLDLLGGVREAHAKIADGFDGVHAAPAQRRITKQGASLKLMPNDS